MTSSQLVLVSVTSALIAVFVMLLVASLKRARSEEREDAEMSAESGTARKLGGGAGSAPGKQPAPDMPPVISGPGAPDAPDEEAPGEGSPRDQEVGAGGSRGAKGGGAKAGGGAKGGGAKAGGAKGSGPKGSGAKGSGPKGGGAKGGAPKGGAPKGGRAKGGGPKSKGSPPEDVEGAGGG